MSIADIKEGTDVNVFSSNKICYWDEFLCGGHFMCCLGCEIVKKTGQRGKRFSNAWSREGLVRSSKVGGVSAVLDRTNTGRTIRTLKVANISSGP